MFLQKNNKIVIRASRHWNILAFFPNWVKNLWIKYWNFLQMKMEMKEKRKWVLVNNFNCDILWTIRWNIHIFPINYCEAVIYPNQLIVHSSVWIHWRNFIRLSTYFTRIYSVLSLVYINILFMFLKTTNFDSINSSTQLFCKTNLKMKVRHYLI